MERIDSLLRERNLKRSVLYDLGIPQQTVSNWKKRGNLPTLDVAEKIADFFELSLDELIQKPKKHKDIILGNTEINLFKKFSILSQEDKQIVENLIDGLYKKYENTHSSFSSFGISE